MKRIAKGFTLIELMIVVVIIGILAGIAVPNYARYRDQATDTGIKILLAEIGSLQREYLAEHGSFLSCPVNPSQPGGAWQEEANWGKLGFAPQQEINRFQFKVEATDRVFVATALCDGNEKFFVTNASFEIFSEPPPKP